jgi:8-oxo-dGTP pyrophosphatase MutT (NUDIX family)
MRFESALKRLKALRHELPPGPAMLTPIRVDQPEDLFADAAGPAAPRRAAVLVLLFPDEAGEARVLLTARATHLPDHAGEISFPGGAMEEEDADASAAALREACEEVGLDPRSCGLRVAGTLDEVAVLVSGFRITPVVATARRRPKTSPEPGEVAGVLDAPLDAFLPGAPIEVEERVSRGRVIRYGVYPVEGVRIWGATARMLGQLGALLAGEPGEAGGPGEAGDRRPG